jgi:purine-binding chemotaxis protein CheW
VKDLVTFRVGGSRYALPAELVTEVVEIEPVAHQVLAEQDSQAPGLTQIRGRWVPVIELAGTLPDCEPLRSAEEGTVLLVLGRGANQLGLKIEELGDVVPAGEGRTPTGPSSELFIEINGDLIRYIDPALLIDSQASLLVDQGGMMEEHQTVPDAKKVVAFKVCADEFAVDVMSVREVLKVSDVRPVPKAPDFVEGVVGVRDAVIPVIDMRKRFSLPERDAGVEGRLLVVTTGDGQVALVVDDVPGVVELPLDELSPAPDFFKGLAGRYLEAIAQSGESLIILLNLDEILSSKEKIALKKMINGGKGSTRKAKPASAKPRKKRTTRRTKKDPG